MRSFILFLSFVIYSSLSFAEEVKTECPAMNEEARDKVLTISSSTNSKQSKGKGSAQ